MEEPQEVNLNIFDDEKENKNEEGEKSDVKLAKVKRTMAKLDTGRLLDEDIGLDKLYQMVKYDLKVKGEGHEASDLCRLMNLYRSWHKEIIGGYTFPFFVQKLGKLSKEPGVRQKMQQLRSLHKGRVEQPNEDMHVDEPANGQEKEPEVPEHHEHADEEEEQYNVEDFNEYREAEEAQMQEDNALEAAQLHEEYKDSVPKQSDKEDSDDLGDLEDVISDA